MLMTLTMYAQQQLHALLRAGMHAEYDKLLLHSYDQHPLLLVLFAAGMPCCNEHAATFIV